MLGVGRCGFLLQGFRARERDDLTSSIPGTLLHHVISSSFVNFMLEAEALGPHILSRAAQSCEEWPEARETWSSHLISLHHLAGQDVQPSRIISEYRAGHKVLNKLLLPKHSLDKLQRKMEVPKENSRTDASDIISIIHTKQSSRRLPVEATPPSSSLGGETLQSDSPGT